jgi:hypothetical protein
MDPRQRKALARACALVRAGEPEPRQPPSVRWRILELECYRLVETHRDGVHLTEAGQQLARTAGHNHEEGR